MSTYLSKSDFKVGRTCPTKLFYKKNHYPSAADDDPYMEMLAEGGFMVGKFAQLLFPEGVMVGDLDVARAAATTAELMLQENVTLFEAAFHAKGLLARVDILEKRGNRVRLIEVKSKGYDPAEGFLGKKGDLRMEWVEYLEDVAFQRHVIEQAYPSIGVECCLMLPDKTALCEIDLLPTWFSITKEGRAVEVDFSGNAEQLRRSRLLQCLNVDGPVSQIWRNVVTAAGDLAQFVHPEIRKAPPNINFDCKACEYRVESDQAKNGFAECWGKLSQVEPSLLELYQFGRTKQNGVRLADDLISRGKVSLFDVPVAALTSAYGPRQIVQIENTRANQEWRSPALKTTLSGLNYPLHFIDFETSRQALPYHRSMKPFEQIAFQWSCHTLTAPDAELKHCEWINVDPKLPNIEFSRALRDAIGNKGTVFTWSHHEETTLKDIARQMEEYRLGDDETLKWLQQVAQSGRIFDLCKHAQAHYFHPKMKGSNSIKAVLPAVWESNPALRAHRWFSSYAKQESGRVLSPYETLPMLEIYDKAEVVAEGTGAMYAYQEMVYGAGLRDPETKNAWRALLAQYCKLDTLAMVMIWQHWTT